MNKDKYKDNYIAVLKAIQEALTYYSWGDITRLYVTKDNGLESVGLDNVRNIVTSLASEGVLQLREDIVLSDFLQDNSPWATAPDYLGGKKRALKNFFWLEVSKIAFKNLLRKHGPPLQLLSLIPNEKKYKNARTLTKLLIEKGKVENSEIVTKIRIKDGYSKIRLTKKDYFRNKDKQVTYNEKIENCLKTLRSIVRPYGYEIKFNQHYTELIENQL